MGICRKHVSEKGKSRCKCPEAEAVGMFQKQQRAQKNKRSGRWDQVRREPGLARV